MNDSNPLIPTHTPTGKHCAYTELVKQVRIFCLFTFILFCNTTLFSQTSTFKVLAGEDPFRVLPVKFRYLNSEFKDGFVSFSTGGVSQIYKFNYDLYKGLVAFIDEKHDTLNLKDETTVQYLHIGNMKFYHDVENGFFKVLATDSVGTLASIVQLAYFTPTNIGYGTTRYKTSAITTVARGVDVTFERTTRFVFMDERRSISTADKVGFLKMFRKKEDLIKSWLKQNKTDFKKEADVVNLFHYCQSLGARR